MSSNFLVQNSAGSRAAPLHAYTKTAFLAVSAVTASMSKNILRRCLPAGTARGREAIRRELPCRCRFSPSGCGAASLIVRGLGGRRRLRLTRALDPVLLQKGEYFLIKRVPLRTVEAVLGVRHNDQLAGHAIHLQRIVQPH